ncbi:hypothetical protein C5B96_09180 [Subtercola sp. Z020]|uniref:hypothetical protein n=1 Tax=Subtercola sp. Z020 TaxID=2080582 RepID=UPI000CE92049|nr:hypothetical protein [Subtercola sp. Z020]PPF82460.1 hypothetical protein C5B96_09180 [Subtercola sp. Z020]
MPPAPSRAAIVRTGIVGLAAVMSGIGSYVLLVLLRDASDAEYANFAVFWSMTVTIGLGFFYPLEQETSRSIAGASHSARGGMMRLVFLAGGGVAVVTSLAALALFTPPGQAYIGSPALVVALIASFIAYAVQFPARGLLSGSHLTTRYSAIIALEGVLRVGLPVLIVALGLAGAVSFAFVVPVATLVSVLPAFVGRRESWRGIDRLPVGRFLGQLARLIGAALSIQLILNSGPLIAKVVGGEDAIALTGEILVCLSIARIPVFAYQVMQILYLPRVASAWRAGDTRAAGRTVVTAVGIACAGALVLVLGMLVLGPFVLNLFFAGKVLSSFGILLVSAGVGLFLIALVVSDGSVALGRHTLVIRSWVIGAVAAVVPVLLLDDPLLRVTGPLIVGSFVAAVQLGIGLARTLRASRVALATAAAAGAPAAR